MSKTGPSRPNRPSSTDAWRDAEQSILDALDLRAEFASLGVQIADYDPSPNGWLSCHAVGRDDRNPSAAINVRTGRYRDLGGSGLSLNLWEFAAQFGTAFADWKEARKHYAKIAGVRLPRSEPPVDPAAHLKFLPWSESLVGLWCAKKPGITPAAVWAAGGRWARYRDQFMVIALPIFGPAGVDSDPVGWTIYNSTGQPLPIYRKNSPTQWKKIKQTYGSGPGLIGADALSRFEDPAFAAVAASRSALTIWSVEGPSDLLALWSAIPAELRASNLVLTNGNGAAEPPQGWMAEALAGVGRVIVIRDADTAGQTSAATWSAWFAGFCPDVRILELPYPVEEKHGRDLRDWLTSESANGDKNDFAALLSLADSAPPLSPPAPLSPEAGAPKVIEADDDPHRLARVFLDRSGMKHPDRGLLLRHWKNEWWAWEETRYQRLDEADTRADVTAAIKAEFDRLNLEAQAAVGEADDAPAAFKVTANLVTNVMGALRSLVAIRATTIQPSWIDTQGGAAPRCAPSHEFIAGRNGILDITLALADHSDPIFPHTPAWFSPVCLPYEFNADARCPAWHSFLNRNLEGDAERIALLQEWAGYLLTPDTSQQHFLVLEGEGANGKSVYCAVVEAILGEENVSHVPLERFGERFDLHLTLGMLANIAADVGELDKAAEGFLKSFVSGDRMSFDRKNLAGVQAAPTARLMIAMNNRPRFSDRTGGLWRRMILVPFNVAIPESERVYGMDKAAWWESRGELPGIFNWALNGLHRLRQNGRFTVPQICRDATEDYRLEVNPARSFLEDHCVENIASDTKSVVLYDAYKKWCNANGYRPLGEAQLGREVRRIFPKAERRKGGPRGSRFWFYAGLTLESEELR